MKFSTQRYLAKTRSALLPVAAESFDRALATGDEYHAWRAVDLAAPDDAARAAIAYHLAHLPAAAQRDPVRHLWTQEHRALRAAANAAGVTLRAMFADAGLNTLPDGWPDVAVIWRGAVGVTLEVAIRGASWTNVRDYACQYAIHGAPEGSGVEPIVVRRQIHRDQIIYFQNMTFAGADAEAYEIVFDAAPEGEIDGTADEWRRIGYRFFARTLRDYDALPSTEISALIEAAHVDVATADQWADLR